MKYIRNISDEQNKVGDTDNVFRLNLFEDTELFNFGTNALTVNIANSSGYILSLTPKKETGNTVIDLDFNDAPLKSLTPDNYLLEVEVKFSDGTTATFPTKGGMPFTVNSNLKKTSGTLVPTVTFDNVLDAVDEKIAVYMDTVKVGPQGPVGPAGNVDTSRDNTFTGTNTFNKKIIAPAGVQGNASSADVLNTRLATFTDFADVAKNMIMYSGNWYTNGKFINNGPLQTGYGVIQVTQGDSSGNGYILFSNWPNDKTYIVHVNNNLLGAWSLLANDSTTVHKTGNETIPGDKAFTGNNSFSGLTTLKTGNYGLRVTTTGVQKTSDGGTTWTNI